MVHNPAPRTKWWRARRCTCGIPLEECPDRMRELAEARPAIDEAELDKAAWFAW
jgi:hypothetical protein